MEWFVAVGGEPKGPISAAQLSELARRGEVTGSDLVWCTGLPEWMPLASVLAVAEQPSPRPIVYEVEVEAAGKRTLSERVASLSQLYIDKLVELGSAPPHRPQTVSGRRAVVLAAARYAHDGANVTARYVESSRGAASAQSLGQLRHSNPHQGAAAEVSSAALLPQLAAPV